jgi:hypothetical protein
MRRGQRSIVSAPANLSPEDPLNRARGRQRAAVLLWLAFAVAIVAAVLSTPTKHRTNGAYRTAALAFVHSQPMYTEGADGFLYPVQSAELYLPFCFEPRLLSELAWRVSGIAILGLATWRLTRAACPDPGRRAQAFLISSLLVIPAAAGAARNGQMNLTIAALAALGAAALTARRWTLGAVWLSLALACKPIAAVFVLLFGAVRERLRVPLVLCLLVVALLPFLHPNWSYVAQEYRAGLAKVLEAGDVVDREFADLTSLLRLVGITPAAAVLTALRAGAALATLACCWRLRRLAPAPVAELFMLTISAAYLMVFNPRTEGNSYVILAVPLAVITAWTIVSGGSRRRVVLLVTACVLLGIAHLFVAHQRDRWIRPAVALAVFGWTVGCSVRGVRRLDETVATQDDAATPPILPSAPAAS